MTEYKISLIPGDGIGPELSDATKIVLDAIKKKFDIKLKIIETEAGDCALASRGVALPEDTVEIIKNSHACMKGPVGESAADVIVKLRVMFDLYANLRPLKAYPAVPVARPDIDMFFVRENTEDVYKGIECKIDDGTALCLRIITRKNSERIAKKAFEIAEQLHPYWKNLRQGARKLQARNSHQILGCDLETPSSFIICWTKNGSGKGGTGQAIRIANYYNIPVLDAGKWKDIEEVKKNLKMFLKENVV